MHNKYKAKDIERTKEMLMAIGRTNLMAPTKEEFGQIIDRDLKKNSVSKLKQLNDFSVSAIFHELEHIVKVETDGLLSLEGVLMRYERNARYYKDVLQAFLRSKQSQVMPKLYAMLDYIILTDTPYEDDRDMSWDEQWDKALTHKVDFRIVILMALGVLPAYSGRGMATSDPLKVIRSFIMDYVAREDNSLGLNEDYYHTVIHAPYNLDDRIAAVAVLYKFCKVLSLTFSVDLSRRVIANSTVILGMDIDYEEVPLYFDNLSTSFPQGGENNSAPVLWWNEKVEHEFWYFDYIGNAYYMVRCNIAKKTYTQYTIFTGSELGTQVCRILHPMSIHTLIDGDTPEYFALASWSVENNRKGEAEKIQMSLISPVGITDDWAKEFRRFTLERMSPSHRHYALFAKNFERKDRLWKLSGRFQNAFPGTEYVLSQSLYAVARDHILVQDIRENSEAQSGFDLIPEKYFKVDKDWVDEDISLGDSIGIMILGVDEPDKPHKKYLALDYICAYLPIIGDEIQYPEENV